MGMSEDYKEARASDGGRGGRSYRASEVQVKPWSLS